MEKKIVNHKISAYISLQDGGAVTQIKNLTLHGY